MAPKVDKRNSIIQMERKSGDRKLDAYRIYNDKATHADRELTRESNESVDTMLVFAGLFSAVISSLLSQTIPLLQIDQAQRTNDLLSTMVNILNKTDTSVTTSPIFTDSTEIPVSAVVVNALFLFSLILSLLAALAAMLVKQWARQYELGLGDQRRLAKQKARNRAHRYLGLCNCHFVRITQWIPMILHAALGIFFIGIIPWLHILHNGIMIGITVLICIGFLLYIGVAAIPTFRANAPFVWPMSVILSFILHSIFQFWKRLYQRRIARISAPHSPPKASPQLVPEYILSSSFNPKENTSSDRDVVDINILTDLLQHTDLNEDIDATLEALRLTFPDGVEDKTPLIENAPVILLRCKDLAESCYEGEPSFEQIRIGQWGRSLRLCQFIEWYYYQLSVIERRNVGDWPRVEFTKALFKDAMDLALDKDLALDHPDNSQKVRDDTIFGDMIIAFSAMSKLHHVRLNEGEKCNMCWTRGSEFSRNGLVELLRTHKFTERQYHPNDGRRPAELAASILASNADCLVNYFDLPTHEDYSQLIEPSVSNQMNMMYVYMEPNKPNYWDLRLYLENLKSKLIPGDPRLKFFKAFEDSCKEGHNLDSDEFKSELAKITSQARHRPKSDNSKALHSIRIISHPKGSRIRTNS